MNSLIERTLMIGSCLTLLEAYCVHTHAAVPTPKICKTLAANLARIYCVCSNQRQLPRRRRWRQRRQGFRFHGRSKQLALRLLELVVVEDAVLLHLGELPQLHHQVIALPKQQQSEQHRQSATTATTTTITTTTTTHLCRRRRSCDRRRGRWWLLLRVLRRLKLPCDLAEFHHDLLAFFVVLLEVYDVVELPLPHTHTARTCF